MKLKLSLLLAILVSTVIAAGAVSAHVIDHIHDDEISSAPANSCQVNAPSLAGAITLYEQICRIPRRDCDHNGDLWTCASYVLGDHAPEITAPVNNPVVVAPVEPVTPVTPVAQVPFIPAVETPSLLRIEAETLAGGRWLVDQGTIRWSGPNLFDQPGVGDPIVFRFSLPEDGTYEVNWRARAFDQSPDPADFHLRNDAWLRVPGTKEVEGHTDIQDWVKVFSSGNGNFHENPHVDDVRDNRPRFGAREGFLDLNIAGRSEDYGIDFVELVRVGDYPEDDPTPAAAGSPIANALFRSDDLLAMFWDCSYDYDDLQAMVATRHILDDYPQVENIAVTGTKRLSHPGTNPGCFEQADALFDTVYNNDIEEENTRFNIVETVEVVATEFQLILNSGNDVWIAEGGPSDFTGDVIRELIDRGVDGLDRIHVVQHSHTNDWNEANSLPFNIQLLEDVVDYIRIDNGNHGNNATPEYNAKFNQGRDEFEQIARNSIYGDQWAFAFSSIEPADNIRRVDFSDAVEVLHILGVPTSQVGVVLDFADVFME